jgi:hypothetical protein
MIRWKSSFVAATLLFSSIACILSGSTEPEVTPDISAMSTSVGATLRAQNDLAPSQTPEKAPEYPSCAPLHPGKQILALPEGFIAGTDNTAISFYDASGNLLGKKLTPGLPNMDSDRVHVAGGITNGLSGVPLVYFDRESNGVLKANINSEIFQLDTTGLLIVLTGAEGHFTYIVYSSAEYTDEGIKSTLKAGEMGLLPKETAQLTRVEDDGLVYYPLAVYVVNEQVQGVWYSLAMYGIGGVIFAPNNGLYYYDLSQNQITEYLDLDSRLKGISPDQSLVAFGRISGGTPGTGFIVKDLTDCDERVIPYYESSIYGGGFTVFSPDNQYLAWIEAGGDSPDPMAPEIRLRIVKLDQNQTSLIDADISTLTSLAGGEIPSFIKPVGWLSNHILLLQVFILDYDHPLLVAYAPDPASPLDPALGSNQSTLLAEGIFAGFLYP